MKKVIGRGILRLFGWRIQVEGDLSKLDRCVLVMAPHTSNWDYFLGILVYCALGKSLKVIIKDTHTKAFYGGIIKKIGAIGVNRSEKGNIVGLVVDLFRKENFSLIITPEGSRSYVKKWRLGFYHIALQADVPIVLASGDYKKRLVHIGHEVKDVKTRPLESIMSEIESFFEGVQGRYPQNYNPKIY